MNVCILLAVIEVVGDNVFTVPIRVEVDGTRRNSTDKSRTKTFEQCSWRLLSVDIPKFL